MRRGAVWQVCGDAAEPSAIVIDSRTCQSASGCFARGVDGGKRNRGIKIHLGVETYGIPLAIDATSATMHDTRGIVPVLRRFAGGGFQGPAIGDVGYRGERSAKAGKAHPFEPSAPVSAMLPDWRKSRRMCADISNILSPAARGIEIS
nr:transposase [Azospirillum melinis]